MSVPTEKTHGEDQLHEYADRPNARFADGESLAAYTTNASEKAGSSRYAESDSGLAHVEASKKTERKLVRKLGALLSSVSSAAADDSILRSLLLQMS
jgi:hypothetical protein